MQISTNQLFDALLLETDQYFGFEGISMLPKNLQDLLLDDIVINQYGVGLKSVYNPRKSPIEIKQSYFEDDQNHFHISDGAIDPEKIFSYGSIMTYALALKLQRQGLRGVRIWFSFQNKEMTIEWAKKNGIYSKNDFYTMNDRVSFYLIREKEELIPDGNINEVDDTALLVIDI